MTKVHRVTVSAALAAAALAGAGQGRGGEEKWQKSEIGRRPGAG